jgi:hypothetical protein
MFEYKTLLVDSSDPVIEYRINKLAKHGWRLVSTVKLARNFIRLFLERNISRSTNG